VARVRIIEKLDLPTANQLIRAFTTFQQLVNVAEQIHDIWKLRYDQFVTPGIPRLGSLEYAVSHCKAAGLSAEAFQALLSELDITLVLTAHPTEAKRRTIQEKTQRISHHLAALDHPLLMLREEENLEAKIFAEITAAWQSDEVRLRPPRVQDEVRNGLFYFDEILWKVLPLPYPRLAASPGRTLSGGAVHHASFPPVRLVDREQPGRQSTRNARNPGGVWGLP
jgi:phosphoenolpyruvate carboxylase